MFMCTYVGGTIVGKCIAPRICYRNSPVHTVRPGVTRIRAHAG